MRKVGAAVAAVTVALGSSAGSTARRPRPSGPPGCRPWACWRRSSGRCGCSRWPRRRACARPGRWRRCSRPTCTGSFASSTTPAASAAGPTIAVHRRILEEILAQGREVTLQMLDGRSLAMVSSLRTIAVEALEMTAGACGARQLDPAAALLRQAACPASRPGCRQPAIRPRAAGRRTTRACAPRSGSPERRGSGYAGQSAP